jgi:hypothetical protein
MRYVNILKFYSIKSSYLLIILICLLPCGLFAYEMEDCVACHSENPDEEIPQISFNDYEVSIHGNLMTCIGCHAYIDEDHEGGEATEKVDCGQCHDQENLHGSSLKSENRPACYSCHTKHRILPAFFGESSTNEKNLKETCAQCHPTEWAKNGYLKWFTSVRISSHKKQDISRDYSDTKCTGCHQGAAVHGDHKIINDETCYRCHLNNNRNGLMGKFHTGNNSGSFILGLSITSQILILIILVSVIRLFIYKSGKKEE